MFHDSGYTHEMEDAQREAYAAFVRTHAAGAVVALVIGAGSTVSTIDAEVAFLRRTCAQLKVVRVDPSAGQAPIDVHVSDGALTDMVG